MTQGNLYITPTPILDLDDQCEATVQAKLDTLRDLWEGALPMETAIGMAGFYGVAAVVATEVWLNWTESFDLDG